MRYKLEKANCFHDTLGIVWVKLSTSHLWLDVERGLVISYSLLFSSSFSFIPSLFSWWFFVVFLQVSRMENVHRAT